MKVEHLVLIGIAALIVYELTKEPEGIVTSSATIADPITGAEIPVS